MFRRMTIRSMVESQLAECEKNLLHAYERLEIAQRDVDLFEGRRVRLMQNLYEMIRADGSSASVSERLARELFDPGSLTPLESGRFRGTQEEAEPEEHVVSPLQP